MLNSLTSLLFPSQCLHCGVPLSRPTALCARCDLAISRRLSFSRIDGFPHTFTATYNEISSSIILQAKEENNSAARTLLAELIALGITDSRSILIPIPSRRAANRSRGYRHSTLLAKRAITLAGGNKRQVIDCLKINARIRDQSGLSLQQRMENLDGRVSVILPRVRQLDSQQIFIIDDLVTSGASAREAIRALRAENIAITGVISACAARPH